MLPVIAQLSLLPVSIAEGAPVILLLFNAGPLNITWAKVTEEVSAIMECFFPAQSTGEALFRVLSATSEGPVVPAARLPATWPVSLQQVGLYFQENLSQVPGKKRKKN